MSMGSVTSYENVKRRFCIRNRGMNSTRTFGRQLCVLAALLTDVNWAVSLDQPGYERSLLAQATVVDL
jgi:hypothetical protein